MYNVMHRTDNGTWCGPFRLIVPRQWRHSPGLSLVSPGPELASHWLRVSLLPPLARHSGIFMSGSCNNKSRSDWIPAWLIRSEIPQIRFHLMTEILGLKNCLFGFHPRGRTEVLRMYIVNDIAPGTRVQCGAALMREYWIFTVVRRQYY